MDVEKIREALSFIKDKITGDSVGEEYFNILQDLFNEYLDLCTDYRAECKEKIKLKKCFEGACDYLSMYSKWLNEQDNKARYHTKEEWKNRFIKQES